MRKALIASAVLIFSFTAVSAGAQTSSDDDAQQRNRAAVRSRHEPRGIEVFGFGDFQMMAAKNTFDAVIGTSTMIGYGAGIDLLRLAGPIFVRFSIARASHSGSRVIAFGDEVVSTDIPLTVTMMPLEIGAGWRAEGERSLRPYFGGGLYWLRYKETTTQFATDEDNTNQGFKGFNGYGGVEFSVGPHSSLGVEGHYRTVPNAIGTAGISAVYAEKDLGGFGVRVMFGFRK